MSRVLAELPSSLINSEKLYLEKYARHFIGILQGDSDKDNTHTDAGESDPNLRILHEHVVHSLLQIAQINSDVLKGDST